MDVRGLKWSDSRTKLDSTVVVSEGERVLQATEFAVAAVAKRWKSAILVLLATGHHRYSEIASRLPGVTAKTLTQQLRDLEDDGLVIRSARAHGPRHVEYALTPIGEALRPTIEAFTTWACQYREVARNWRDRERTREVHRDSPRHTADTVPPRCARGEPGFRDHSAS